MRSAIKFLESFADTSQKNSSNLTCDIDEQVEPPPSSLDVSSPSFAANDPCPERPTSTSGETNDTSSETCISQVAPTELKLVHPVPFKQPRAIPPTARFELLQQFEGTVIDINDKTICAKLIDRTRPDNSLGEYIEFDAIEIAPDDMNLVRLGAVFYWNIGYRTQPWGQRERVSSFRFRRMPAWTRMDIRSAHNLAEEWAYMFENDTNESS